MSAEQGVLVEGLEERRAESSLSVASEPPGERKLRLKPVDRQQVCFRVIDPERLVEEDHPVRAIWDLLEPLDLSRFYAGIRAVEGRAGREACDPRVMIALWLYALSRGVREARALDAWSQYEPGCQWLLGLGRINYHTLSDFVTEHAAALDNLFVQVLHVLMEAGAADLERVAHDGTKIRAAASRQSFKREERLAECRELIAGGQLDGFQKMLAAVREGKHGLDAGLVEREYSDEGVGAQFLVDKPARGFKGEGAILGSDAA
jgi:transposase